MAGECNLTLLLRTMAPVLADEPYGFLSLPPSAPPPAGFAPFALIAEAEGLTVVAPIQDLEAAGLPTELAWARISLEVHSDLSSVGLTAAIAGALAARDISANVIAGYFHDHIFLPWPQRQSAMDVLRSLSSDRAGA